MNQLTLKLTFFGCQNKGSFTEAFPKYYKALFSIKLKFYSDQTSIKSYDKVQKLPCKIYIIILVDLRFFFYMDKYFFIIFRDLFKIFLPTINWII